MGDVVNLRRARKARQKRDAAGRAEANRIAFGRTKVERGQTAAEKALGDRLLDGHRLDGNPSEKE